MAGVNINRVVLSGNLTRDPELRALPSGASVCAIRLATSVSWRSSDTGEWEDRPNYFDVSVFGGQAETCARYLAKGRPVAIDGRLDWHEWETPDGDRRQAVQVIADRVQFLGSGPGAGGETESGGAAELVSAGAEAEIAF
ncbi:MAG: single-stranded DNA-binding protein [Solirubrobacteraceae bacterium]